MFLIQTNGQAQIICLNTTPIYVMWYLLRKPDSDLKISSAFAISEPHKTSWYIGSCYYQIPKYYYIVFMVWKAILIIYERGMSLHTQFRYKMVWFKSCTYIVLRYNISKWWTDNLPPFASDGVIYDPEFTFHSSGLKLYIGSTTLLDKRY